MATKPGNIGKARCKVMLLPKSPFAGVPRQEWGYFFTQDNINAMTIEEQKIVALPPPVSGFRLAERLENYDNFIVDANDVRLEEATASGAAGTITPNIDDAAKQKSDLAIRRRNIDATKREFFTWKTHTPIVTPTAGRDAPLLFQDMLNTSNNQPKWTYNIIPKPDGNKTNEILTPFMTQACKDPRIPIHWGLQTLHPIATGQPFEVLFYHTDQVHTVAPEAPAQTVKWHLDEKPFNLNLTSRAYFAIKFGDAPQYFMLLFVQGSRPLFLQVNKDRARILDVFDDINSDALFTPDNQWFQCRVEPVKSGFLVSLSGQQFVAPWAIQSPSSQFPYIMRQGRIEVFSGNVTAGVAFRPIQYEPIDFFSTPSNLLTRSNGDTRDVTVTTSIKGIADSQGRLSKDKDGNSVIFAVDAEKVEGDSLGQVRSVIKDLAKDPATIPDLPGERKIKISMVELPDPNKQAPPPGKPATPDGALNAISKKAYQIKVGLVTADMRQPNGYVVENGKSPYIWQARAELPMVDPTGDTDTGIDISCDVKEVDLNFNSTSLNELNHSGTIKVFNRPKATGGSGIDYYGYIDRAVYFRIDAWFEGGQGHDPLGDNRQVFEGMSVQATVDRKAEHEIVTFKIEDYMNALEGGKFVLSPYYDGMKAKAAIKDIAKLAGLPENRIFADDKPIPTPVPRDPKEYGLPFSNPFQEPQFRFKDGSSYKAAIVKIAQLDGKTVYFDNKGRFHYDTIAGGTTGPARPTPKVNFFSSPKNAASGKFVVWNVRSYSRQINDTYNVIQVSTVDRDTGDPIHIADANESALHDPQATGYLGYRKHLIIREPALGGVAAAIRYFMTYRDIIFKPPMTARLELYGYSGIKPLDVISIDGDPIRILNISSHINAQENTYWMNLEGEWFFPTGKMPQVP